MKVIFGLLFLVSLTPIMASAPALILTRFIKKNLINQAKQLSAVDPTLFLNRTSYSGFFTVDERLNSNLFFWYIEAENHKANDPWIVWLQGGPGVTSLAGLFDEIGPFIYTNGQLKARKWTWSKKYSILFIDNPVGSGFSFTNSPDGFIQDMTTCSSHLYSALRQFLMMFPELRKAPLYLAGESYAGRYIPALAVKILEQDRNIGILDVKLKGIILGSPVLSRASIAEYSAIYYQWGLIDSQGLLAAKPLQDAYNKALASGDSIKASHLRDELLVRLDEISMQQQTFNVLLDNITNLEECTRYITKPEVLKALHVGNIKFSFYNNTVHKYMRSDFLSEVQSKVEMLLNHYRVLMYCGQMDMTAPCVPNAQARRKHWHWNYRDQFLNAPRNPWWYNNRVAGYGKSGGGLTEVLLRGAGHLVPMDKPEETTVLVDYFIRGLDLNIPPNYQVLSQDTPKYIDDELDGISKAMYELPGEHAYSGTRVAMVVSVVLNVLLLFGIACGVVYALRWKRRNDIYIYNTMDDNNIISTGF